MFKFWKIFWLTITSVFNSIHNIASAGEKYTAELDKDAAFSAEKAEQKREAKRAKWAAKNAP